MAQTMKKGRVYIAGPMRGYKFYNFDAFDRARDELARDGWAVVSPADMDRNIGLDAKSFPDTHDWTSIPPRFDMRQCARRCTEAIIGCDAICMLPYWQKSAGAVAERALAMWIGLQVMEFHEDKNPDKPERTSVLEEAERLINSDRQAQYGPPEQDFKRTSDMWTALLQYKLKEGECIRMQDVAWMMMCLKASRAQHLDKRDNYVDAAGYVGCGWRCVESQKGDADGCS